MNDRMNKKVQCLIKTDLSCNMKEKIPEFSTYDVSERATTTLTVSLQQLDGELITDLIIVNYYYYLMC